MKLNEQLNIGNILGVACLLALSGAMSAKADLIDVQFAGSTGKTMTGAAATGSAGDQWNGISSGSSDSDLNDVSGTATGVGLSISDPEGHGYYTSGDGFDSLLSGYFVGYSAENPESESATAAPATFSLTGLQAGASYSLYVYGGSGSMRPEAVTVNGIEQTVSDGPGSTSGFSNGVSYTAFAVTADANGDLSFMVENNSSGGYNPDPETDVNGFQLFSAQQAQSGAPEPSTWGLLGGGLALIAAITRKRSNVRA